MTGRYQIRVGIQHGCYGASQGTGLPLDEVNVNLGTLAATMNAP